MSAPEERGRAYERRMRPELRGLIGAAYHRDGGGDRLIEQVRRANPARNLQRWEPLDDPEKFQVHVLERIRVLEEADDCRARTLERILALEELTRAIDTARDVERSITLELDKRVRIQFKAHASSIEELRELVEKVDRGADFEFNKHASWIEELRERDHAMADLYAVTRDRIDTLELVDEDRRASIRQAGDRLDALEELTRAIDRRARLEDVEADRRAYALDKEFVEGEILGHAAAIDELRRAVQTVITTVQEAVSSDALGSRVTAAEPVASLDPSEIGAQEPAVATDEQKEELLLFIAEAGPWTIGPDAALVVDLRRKGLIDWLPPLNPGAASRLGEPPGSGRYVLTQKGREWLGARVESRVTAANFPVNQLMAKESVKPVASLDPSETGALERAMDRQKEETLRLIDRYGAAGPQAGLAPFRGLRREGLIEWLPPLNPGASSRRLEEPTEEGRYALTQKGREWLEAREGAS